MTGNLTLILAMAGRNALSVELIKPTGDQAIVSSYFIQLLLNGRVHKDTSHAHLVLDLTVFNHFTVTILSIRRTPLQNFETVNGQLGSVLCSESTPKRKF